MNTINVALLITVVTIVLAEGWIGDFKVWVAGKVGETQMGQTKT